LRVLTPQQEDRWRCRDGGEDLDVVLGREFEAFG
jgi:hypothetical protein